MENTLIIAEAGVNHNGSVDMALQLVDVAAEAGADVVKFQTFKSETVISGSAPKADYQITNTGQAESQLEMVRKLELSPAAHHQILAHCGKRGIRFLSTPFDEGSARFLVDELNMQIVKVPSGEITNAPLLLAISRLGKPLIVSTGMSTLGEIEIALGVIAFGYLGRNIPPGEAAFRDAFASEEGRTLLAQRVSLLHCTTEYPAPFEHANLRAMDTLRSAFGLPTGFSDHTPGIAAPIAAVARGASIIEKHFTLDRNLPGPDHVASLEPVELAAMVTAIRQVEKALGSAHKGPSAVEWGNRVIARRSLVAARDISAGEPWTAENLTAKRPGGGLSPMRYWEMLGNSAAQNYRADEMLIPEQTTGK
jgi:N-acetylneuraminate synthase